MGRGAVQQRDTQAFPALLSSGHTGESESSAQRVWGESPTHPTAAALAPMSPSSIHIMYPTFLTWLEYLPPPNRHISLTVFDHHPLEAGSTTRPCPVTMLTQH